MVMGKGGERGEEEKAVQFDMGEEMMFAGIA